MSQPVSVINWDAMRRAVGLFQTKSDELAVLEGRVNNLRQEAINAWKGDTSNKFVISVEDWLKGFGTVIQALNTLIEALQKALNKFHETEGTNTNWVPKTDPTPGFGVLSK